MPAAPSMMAPWSPFAPFENHVATAAAPSAFGLAPAPWMAVASDRTTTSGSSKLIRASKSPRAGGCQKCAGDPQTAGAVSRRQRCLRLAGGAGPDWRSAVPRTDDRPTIGPISSNGIAKMSCSTNTTRSVGASRSSTTSSADPTDSARSACCSGSNSSAMPTTSSGSWSPAGSSRRDRRARSWSRHSLATTVVSHPFRFSTAPTSARLSRSHASWTASSASAWEPSMR